MAEVFRRRSHHYSLDNLEIGKNFTATHSGINQSIHTTEYIRQIPQQAWMPRFENLCATNISILELAMEDSRSNSNPKVHRSEFKALSTIHWMARNNGQRNV